MKYGPFPAIMMMMMKKKMRFPFVLTKDSADSAEISNKTLEQLLTRKDLEILKLHFLRILKLFPR